jgi:hypothetical protein
MNVAITGHRPNRLHIGVHSAALRLKAVLRELRDGTGPGGAGGQNHIAISALAEGSDRLFAAAALDLGYELRVVLPFPSADYETTFGDHATTPDYRALLARASTVTELPGVLADSTPAYEAVGRLTVEQADIVVAVWDGKPAAGRGGTPEIMQYALDLDRPVIWIDAGNDRPPTPLRRSAVHGQLDAMAKAARR